MRAVIKKLVLGSSPSVTPVSAIAGRIKNIKAIWNNEHDNDMGIEKMFRLFLAASPFIFPGVYIKEIVGRKGRAYSDLAVDIFVLFKEAFPVVLLFIGFQNKRIHFAILFRFMTQTQTHVPNF